MATLTSKGQVTIPRAVREALDLRTGDRLEFEARPDGTLLARPRRTSLMNLRALVDIPGSDARIEAWIAEARGSRGGEDEDDGRDEDGA